MTEKKGSKASRNEAGRFVRGHDCGGRPAGCPNRLPAGLREMLVDGLEDPKRVSRLWRAVDKGLAMGDATAYLTAARLVLPRVQEADDSREITLLMFQAAERQFEQRRAKMEADLKIIQEGGSLEGAEEGGSAAHDAGA